MIEMRQSNHRNLKFPRKIKIHLSKGTTRNSSIVDDVPTAKSQSVLLRGQKVMSPRKYVTDRGQISHPDLLLR
jgi:hypothetical protein